MPSIYLVRLVSGSCCDREDRNLRAFQDKAVAEYYAEDMKRQIDKNGGLYDAVQAIMGDTWDKAHVAPEMVPYGEEGYESSREAYYAHRDARSAELDRLLAVVGWDKALHFYCDEVHLSVQEVPFGYEE